MTTNTTSMSADSAQSAHVPNAEELYRSLRGDILTSALAPGAVVSQVKLARQLGVNRTPLREALRMLQQEGLVEAEHNRRVRIAALSDEDLVDIYSLRILQEAVSIRVSLPRLTAARLRSLDQSITELEQFAAFELLDQWERSYSDFHRTLLSGAGERLRSAVGDLLSHSERYHRALLQQSPINFMLGARELREIAVACAERNVSAAVESLTQHTARTAFAIISMRNPAFDPVTLREALRLVHASDSLPDVLST